MISFPLQWEQLPGLFAWSAMLESDYAVLIGPVENRPGRWASQLTLNVYDEQGELDVVEAEVLLHADSPLAAMQETDRILPARWLRLTSGVEPLHPGRILMRGDTEDGDD